MKKKHISMLLIVVGILIIGLALFMRYDGYIKEKKMMSSFEKTVKDLNKEDTYKVSDSEDSNTNFQNTIGIMEIPKIDLKVAIGDGVDKDTLKYAVGHFKNTPYPGEKGNASIAGHRSYTYSEYFNRLDEVSEGDKIIIQTQKGKFTYIVYKKYVVLPEEVSVLNDTEGEELTLITCTPIRVATHRLIIKAKLN